MPLDRWSTRHRHELEKRSSVLEFKLHRQRYLQLLEASRKEDAIAYAKQNFGYFGTRHTQGKTMRTSSSHAKK